MAKRLAGSLECVGPSSFSETEGKNVIDSTKKVRRFLSRYMTLVCLLLVNAAICCGFDSHFGRKGPKFGDHGRVNLAFEVNDIARNVELIGEIPHSLTYRLPAELMGVALKGRYCGQRQWWFAMRFLGTDSDISIVAKNGAKAEFDEWAWRSIDELQGLIVPFKREMYATVISAFRHLAVPVSIPAVELASGLA